MRIFLACILFLVFGSLSAQRKALSTVRYLQLTIEQTKVRMAYKDLPAAKPNGSTVLLLHGKNFSGFYWKDVASFLNDAGYRVVVPDQVGFGYSDKPALSYSFHMLAATTKKLLDTLGTGPVHVIAHSMGGMLASRFIMMYPGAVKTVIYENPIGLEDYKTFVPYRSFDEQYKTELTSTLASLKKYQQSYFPRWKAEYDLYVQAQWEAMNIPSFSEGAWASAATYQMIYEQPVLYELKNIRTPALIIIGQADRTVVGKNLLDSATAAAHGNYPVLGRRFHETLVNSKLVELEGVGHIPHLQEPLVFKEKVLEFLTKAGQSTGKVIEPQTDNIEWSRPYTPLRIAGNLYYVGTYDLASYLIVTTRGNILINTGLAGSASTIRQNIAALGFKVSDIKVLLTTQAHFDHVGAMAGFKKETGAKMMVDAGDAEVLADGGQSDYALGGATSTYEPVIADRILHDQDSIVLGEMKLTMLHHPGHTKGSCSFIFDVKDSSRTYRVLIANMPTIVTEKKRFADVENYPAIAADYRYTLDAMKQLKFDLLLSSHASQFDLHTKHKPGQAYNPSVFIDQKRYEDALKKLEAEFRDRL